MINRSLKLTFADLNLPQLTDRDSLEAPITDFCRSFEENDPILLEVYSDAFEAGTLPESMHTAVISFIHKRGKDDLEPIDLFPYSAVIKRF